MAHMTQSQRHPCLKGLALLGSIFNQRNAWPTSDCACQMVGPKVAAVSCHAAEHQPVVGLKLLYWHRFIYSATSIRMTENIDWDLQSSISNWYREETNRFGTAVRLLAWWHRLIAQIRCEFITDFQSKNTVRSTMHLICWHLLRWCQWCPSQPTVCMFWVYGAIRLLIYKTEDY